MSHSSDIPPGFGPPPRPPRQPGNTRGPQSKLTDEVIQAVCDHLARGNTRRDSAALAGITEDLLAKSLERGRAHLADSKPGTIQARLVMEVDGAEAYYRAWLVGLGNQSAVDKTVSDKWLRWRLATSAPKDYTVPSTPTGPKQDEETTQTISPADAAASVTEKLTRFLATRAPVTAPAPTEAEGAES